MYSEKRRLSLQNGFHPKTSGSKSMKENCTVKEDDEFEETPLNAAVMTYLSYFFLLIFGYLRDFMRKYGLEKSKGKKETGNKVIQYLDL